MVLLGIGNNPMVGCTVACAVIRLYRDTLSGVSLFYLHTLTRKWLFLRQGLMKINQNELRPKSWTQHKKL